jgi:tRNA(Ile)-lysidine synthase
MPHRSNLYSRWSQEVKRSRYFHAGERVGVAISGGPDSNLLLEFMKRFSREAGLQLAAIHFNHKLRGEESDADERFVRQRAEALGIEFLRAEADTNQAAKAQARNLEAIARELRYRFFFSLLNCGKVDKIVTAHTANDQAETVLLRLLRGTGSKGLGGIYPVLEGKVYRPFLNVSREEIEREIQDRKLEFVIDASNRNLRFQRNKIRMELLPRLKNEFNREIVSLLADLSQRARADEEVLEQVARERAHPWRVRDGAQEKIPIRPLAEFPAALQRRVLRQMVQTASGNLRGVTHRHIEALRQLSIGSQSGCKLLLPGGLEARRDFDWLVLEKKTAAIENEGYRLPVKIPGEVKVPRLETVFRFKIIEAPTKGKTYNEQGLAGLDPQKLTGKLVLRNWRPGDRFQPMGSLKVHKLKELMARSKIPATERKSWPVLESGGEIVWVRGFPPASGAAASPSSGQLILIEEISEPRR